MMKNVNAQKLGRDKMEIKEQKKCRICFSKKLYKFVDLGNMPIPNGFLKENQLTKDEKKYPLACYFCEDCGLVQLTHVVNPKIMFSHYVYVPSGARVMLNNFNNLANEARKQVSLNSKSLVCDIGSNDGSLLKAFKPYGVRVLGIDPAKNLAKLAIKNGIPTEAVLFNEKNTDKIIKKWGRADVVTATNVIAHIDDLHEVFKSLKNLLKTNGVFITEFPYLLDLIEKNQFDTIYHEHLSYFSLKPWQKIAGEYGFEITSIQRLSIHGGSIRIFHKKKEKIKLKKSRVLNYLINLEEQRGLYVRKTYDDFTKRLQKIKNDLNFKLNNIKKSGKKIVGYGAPAKGNVLTHFFDIGKDVLDYIVDSTPYKQGLFTPGKHIPIFSEQQIDNNKPDYLLILAWNFANEIISKNRKFKRRGGKFIIPIPEVKII